MNLEKIFENDLFILYKDNKGFDFAYDIENKTDNKITIQYGDYDEELEIGEWLGLFADEEYIIESILNNNYKVV